MKKTMVMFLILTASAAGISFAGSNSAGYSNSLGNRGFTTMDNSDNSTSANSDRTSSGSGY